MRCHGFEVLAPHQVMVVVFVLCSFSSSASSQNRVCLHGIFQAWASLAAQHVLWFSDTVVFTSRGLVCSLLNYAHHGLRSCISELDTDQCYPSCPCVHKIEPYKVTFVNCTEERIENNVYVSCLKMTCLQVQSQNNEFKPTSAILSHSATTQCYV